MARQPKPWWRKDRKSWFVTIDGKRHDLGPNRKVALQQFHALMTQPKERARVNTESVLAIIDAFLDWTKRHRAERTYTWYLDRCQSFAKFVGDMRVAHIRPFHVQNWIDSHPPWSNGHRRGCIIAVQRAFRWAAKLGHLDVNPLAFIEKPAPGKRDRIVTIDEYGQILGLVADTEFRDVLTVAWETGCRPQELVAVEARHVDLHNARWVFPPSESKVKKFPRIVYLTDESLAITKQLMLRYPSGKLFRNRTGKPWTAWALNCRFTRIQVSLGRRVMREQGIDVPEKDVNAMIRKLAANKCVEGKNVKKSEAELREEAKRKLRATMARSLAPKYCLYLFRHSFATRLLEAGVDALTVAILLGHSNPTMLSTTYQHLAHNPKHLAEQLRRAAS